MKKDRCNSCWPWPTLLMGLSVSSPVRKPNMPSYILALLLPNYFHLQLFAFLHLPLPLHEQNWMQISDQMSRQQITNIN